MRSFGVNNNNDLYLGSNGNLAVVTGQTAVMNSCAQAVKTQLRECIYQKNLGIDYNNIVWRGTPDTEKFKAALIAALLNVPNVEDVKSVTVTQVGNTLSYTARIVTEYGEGEISG